MVVTLLLYNFWWKLRHIAGRSTTEVNALVSEFDTNEACDYIEGNFAGYELAAGTTQFSGRMLEIGPGGSAGGALLAREAGCEAVDLVDRFVVVADERRMSAVYQELARRHKIDQFRVGASWSKFNLSEITWFEGNSAESFLSRCARESVNYYSWIVSTAVIQDLYNPLSALRDMVTCLKPGGKMVHYIDTRDQGFFSQYNHELTWLTIPSFLWPALTRASGAPNRVLLHRYEAVLAELEKKGLITYKIFVTGLLGNTHLEKRQTLNDIRENLWASPLAEVEARKAGFAKEFRQVPSKYLAVTSFVLVVEKTSSSTSSS
ncbi:methyltransferase domain-containing protein [Methylobacterium durans]|uniref:methyltransferase domain-containing protein n=1 Tax=Methylobacterium durans TaxID=2202825 RepID=UPI002AFF9138|nr:methyltransferase domain-containing protein [Methylobacterium durans]MEA1834640.1 methyltransferase domain-containing protein [Methylobacterium durans]